MLTPPNALKYYQEMIDETDNSPYGRYRSWWYCYQAFSEAFAHPGTEDRNYLTLSLAFYLASWGMYRGSSFLLQHDYQVHRIVVDYLLDDPSPRILWASSQNQVDFYSQSNNVNTLIDTCTKLETLYKMNDPKASVTATLASKVLMGTLGCTPAYDKYVVESIKEAGFINSPVRKDGNFEFIRQSISNISKFYFDNVQTFQKVKMKPQGFYYPPMKIMDMVLWRMSFRKREAEKILSMKSSQNKGRPRFKRPKRKTKSYRIGYKTPTMLI
jgi:hypothetical protein